ncbi:MAG: ABC transporter ATP-binding protein [Synergistaceae bacterium]|nr:ABC transporter ATP-binding protein [Synergistaceae bacterium]
MNGELIKVQGLKKFFYLRTGVFSSAAKPVKALDGLTFGVGRGETAGVVGESGCGKTTLARIILGLETPTEGSVLIDGMNPFDVKGAQRRALRRKVGVVFQSPQASLNPRATIGQSLLRPLILHGYDMASALEMIGRVSSSVNLGRDLAERYPHQLSGGQQQRACIARALLLSPEIMLLDEPTSALDVSVQAQIINVLLDLQRDMGLTYIFISHDLNLVRAMSDRIIVLYMGLIMEEGPAEDVFNSPAHPYTRALMNSSPPFTPRRSRADENAARDLIRGEPPSLIDLPPGCRFQPRCPQARDKCSNSRPEPQQVAPNRLASCFFAGNS